jgi:uncharacterized protein YvpB
MEISNNQNLTDRNQPLSIQTALIGLLSSEPVLVVLNILLLGGFLTYLLFSNQPEQGLASEIQPPTQTQEPLIVNTVEPTPSPSATHVPTLAPSTPTQTASPSPTNLPPTPLPVSAVIDDIKGYKQSMPLSCESSSAVDWAAYFGVDIDEKEFFDGLPKHDNPEIGFVGDVYGSWGQIPPKDYGVHAGPIAQRLREYGLNAMSVRQMTLEELKTEIAAGRPVILWVIGHVRRGTPVPYTGSDGEETIVAKFEHTVIAIGYTENKIKVLDGYKIYDVYQGEFMKSWNVLENLAVVWIE